MSIYERGMRRRLEFLALGFQWAKMGGGRTKAMMIPLEGAAFCVFCPDGRRADP
jgi:hypothetical protein